MQFRQLSKLGHRSLRMRHANGNRLYQMPRRNINNYIMNKIVDYQHNYNIQGWEIPMLQATVLDFVLCTWAFSFNCASEGWINKVFNFSIGTPRQGAYFPPHCRYITPYDEMVRNHKKKLKEEAAARGE